MDRSSMTVAHLLRVLVWIAAVLVILIPTLGWLSPGWQGVLQLQPAIVIRADRAGTPRSLLFAALVPPYLCAAWGLFQLSGFCARLSRGEHFSRAAAVSLRRFGISLVLAAALLPPSRILARALVQAGPHWEATTQPLLGVTPILAVVFGVVLGLVAVVFAALLDKATNLAEENARFV
jgi:hypothetical protein